MARGVYIHIPFCHQICNYCDFNKFYFKNQPVDEYIEALGKEMALTTENILKNSVTSRRFFLVAEHRQLYHLSNWTNY